MSGILDDRDIDIIRREAAFAVNNLIFKAAGREPQMLWHYTTAKGFLGILDSKQLFGSHIATMNDAFEYRHSVEVLAQAVMSRLTDRANNPPVLMPPIMKMLVHLKHEWLTNIKIVHLPNTYVACFSSVVDQTTHWSEYGDRGRGYALGFDTQDLIEISGQQNAHLLPCIYDPQKAFTIMYEAVNAAESSFAKIMARHPDEPFDQLLPQFAIAFIWSLSFLGPAFKNASFSNETEWRFSIRLPNFDTRQLTFTDKGAEIRPYFKFDLLRRDLKATHIPLRKVVIGPTRHDIDKEIADIAVPAMLKQKGYGNVEVVRSESGYRGGT